MSKRGFTLVELAAVMGIVTLVAGTLAPGVKATRLKAQARGSESNLMQIGQGSDMYALDNKGRIFSYSWQAGFDYMIPDGTFRRTNNDVDATRWQNTEILMRLTDRIHGPLRFKNGTTRVPHTRMRSLVLIDYLGYTPTGPVFVDPADANLLQWQANPTDTSAANHIPYAEGSTYVGYDDPSGWTDLSSLQRWPYSTSYLSATSAWVSSGEQQPPSEASVYPFPLTPHLQVVSQLAPVADGRSHLEVIFPSAKVHLFEEFDREQAGSPYFAYDHARPAKLMFDGSVNDWASGAAWPSWNPNMGKNEWRQHYVPLHTFPVPLSGLGETTLLSQRYRWTLGGLKGVDYPQPLMGR